MEEDDFDDELIDQINNSMTFAHPLVHSFKIYFLRDLRKRGFSIDDVRRFCIAQKRILPWLGTLNWEDVKENRLPFNPYCDLPEYNDAEKGFTTYYSISNKAPFQKFMQDVKQNATLTAKISLVGLSFVQLHAIRALRELQHTDKQSAKFLTEELAGTKFPALFKTITTNILSNQQPLLQIDNVEINNTDLLLKSVITHIIAFHASVESNSSQLSMYLHKLQDCQNSFILTCISDVESVLLNAVATFEKSTRYACRCGHVYIVAGCGNVTETATCPKCKNTIGGAQYNVPAAGNTRLDNTPVNHISAKDQPGYIFEPADYILDHSVRSLPPTSYRILHLIVHTLIGASAPQFASAFLRKNSQNVIDTEKYCMDHIRNDWTVLKSLLHCSDENLALMFHSLISLMIEKPPLPNQQIKTPAERENWEAEFQKNYIAPQTRNITETAANYLMKLNAALAKNKKGNVIEGEINQTLIMDKQYRVKNLPSLWRTIGMVSFDSFRAYYTSDLARNKSKYPFLSVFFKHAKQLELIKHLLPIVKFVQILNSKLGYHLTRQKASEMTFRQFIEKESNNDNKEIYDSLKAAFDDFKGSWNEVMPHVERYQCHEIPQDKPIMHYEHPVVFGLMEPKDEGVFLCAIIDHLINLQNNFLREIMEIPPKTCRSLRFLDELTFNVEKNKAQSAQPNTSNGYCLQSIRIDHACSGNIIDYEWDNEILQYSQRNLMVARGEDIVYDLTKIEAELANILVFEKVHIETQPESQLYLEPFPYHMELFQGYMRILDDIKNLITQEPIPVDKMTLLGAPGISNAHGSEEILSSLEILLCFVKRTTVGDGDKPIKDYVSQWMKLSSLSGHAGFSKILNIDLRLKHLVALYEFVEEQVANLKIKYIHEKYKAPLSKDIEVAIERFVDFEEQTTTKEMVPAYAFALALKRFMLRFLTLESQKEMEPIYPYMQDTSLNFWPSTIPEERIEELSEFFPENLLVANTYAAYEFTMKNMKKIEQMMKKKQANVVTRSQTINQQNQNPRTVSATSTSRKSKNNKKGRFDRT